MPESRRLPVREGYDLWSSAYDTTDNPVVALDARETMRILAPIEGETILDAGCGTGRNLRAIASAGCPAVGVDFSTGMLTVARSILPGIPLVCADIAVDSAECEQSDGVFASRFESTVVRVACRRDGFREPIIS